MTDDRASTPQHAWEDKLFRLIVDNSADFAAFIVDAEGRILAWSRGAQQVFGYSKEEAVGMSSFVLFTPEDVQNGVPTAEMRTTLDTGRAEDERWHLRKDGSRFWTSGATTLLRDEAGQVQGIAKVLRDLTARKQAELALRESEQRLRVALWAAQMGTWLWDVRADRQLLDDNLKRLMGLPPDAGAFQFDDFIRAIYPDDQAAVREAFDKALHEGVDISSEFRIVRPDGAVHWLRDQGRVLRDESGAVVSMTGACVDITERKQLEEALRVRAEQLAEADRSKDEFLAMLGHELRNPLAPIRSVLELLRHHPPTGPLLEKAYATIDRQVSHLTGLVDDLLDVARITRRQIPLHKKVVDLRSIMESAVETVRPIIEARRHEMMVSMPIHQVWLEADPTRLGQVLTNLLHNSAKYTDPEGRIWLTAERDGDELVIRVRDNGAGIPQDLLPRVFDLFTQGERSLARSSGGLGLGLTLVRRLVELHGGTVEAKSEGPGRGSEFTVRLPAPRIAAPPPEPSAKERDTGAPAQKHRILVVDDNSDVADSLSALLLSLGHEVAIAHDGVRALATAEQYHPDVVLLDIGLPGMDGFTVARELRRMESTRGALVVALSGYGQEDDRRRSREAGFDEHLVKPVSRATLQSILARRRRACAGAHHAQSPDME